MTAAAETQKHKDAKTQKRRGVILPVMLLILILLGLLAAGFAFRVHADRSAMNAVSYRMQARLAAESGIQKALLLLRTQRTNVAAWYNNPDEFNRIIVWTPGDETLWGTNQELEENAFAYRFSLVADSPYDDEEKCRYGLTDESAKLNINTASEQQLRRLLGQIATEDMIVDELVDALLDWRDEDDTPREFGAESAYYNNLDTRYQPKNGRLDTVEELLMVKGFDGRVLYGEDQDRNGLLTPNEDDGDDSFPEDDGDGKLNRGLYPYITVLSRDQGTDRDNRPRVYLYGDQAQVREQLAEFIEEAAKIDFILSALSAPSGGDPTGGGAEADAQSEENAEAQQEDDADGGRQGGDDEADPSSPRDDRADDGRGAEVDPGEQERSEGRGPRPRGGTRKDRRRSQVRPSTGEESEPDETAEGDQPREDSDSTSDDTSSGGGRGQPARLGSPAELLSADAGGGNPLTIDDLPVLMERTTTLGPLEVREGSINVMTAPPEVLRCLDGLDGESIGAIMAARQELAEEEQFSTAWLVTREILTLEQYQQVAPLITSSGLQFTIEALGYADHIGMVARLQVIVEMRGPLGQVLYYRDLTSLGAVYPIREGEAEYGFGGQRG